MKNVNLTNRAERTVLKSHSAHWLTFADWICKQRPIPLSIKYLHSNSSGNVKLRPQGRTQRGGFGVKTPSLCL